MKIVFTRQYRKRETGKLVFIYKVIADEKTLAAYKASKGEHYKEDKETKEPLFFSTRFIGKMGELRENANKQWAIDTTEADQLISMTEQCGGNVALAKELLAKQNEQ